MQCEMKFQRIWYKFDKAKNEKFTTYQIFIHIFLVYFLWYKYSSRGVYNLDVAHTLWKIYILPEENDKYGRRSNFWVLQ